MRTIVVLAAVVVLCDGFGDADAKPQPPPINVPRPPPVPIPVPVANVIAASPDGKVIAVGWGVSGPPFAVDGSGRVELVGTKTGRGPGILLNHSPRLQGAIVTSALTFSADGSRLAVGDSQGRIVIWDATKTGNELVCFDVVPESVKMRSSAEVRAVAFFPDGRSLVTVTADGFLKRWNAADGKMLSQVSLNNAQQLTAIAFSKDGMFAASALDIGLIQIWEVEAGTRKQSIDLPKSAVVESLAFAADKGKLVVSYRTGPITVGGAGNVTQGKTVVFDAQTGQRIREIPTVCSDAEFSPSGKMLVTCDTHGPIRVWDIPSGKNVLTWSSDTGYKQMIASPDGVHVIGRWHGGVTAWDVMTGERVMAAGTSARVWSDEVEILR